MPAIQIAFPKKTPDREFEGFAATDLLSTEGFDCAEIVLTRRYPLLPGHMAVNKTVTMMARILEGAVILRTEGDLIWLPEGAVVIVHPNIPYFWDPLGDRVRMFVVCSPKWDKDQHETVLSK